MRSRVIRSPRNPLVKRILKVKARPEKYAPSAERPSGEVLIEGPRPLSTALACGAAVEAVLVTEGFMRGGRHGGVLEGLSVPVTVIDDRLMARISDTVTPQGIIALSRVRAAGDIDRHSPGEDELIVVSDGIQDPGNPGTIVRVCDGAGVRSFVCLKGSANPFTPKAVRASAGSVFGLKVFFAPRESFLHWCRRHGVRILITEPGAEETVFDTVVSGPVALVFGNEAAGVSREVRGSAGLSLCIPMSGRAESLNVASAAAITIYELMRKRGLRRGVPS